MNKLKPCPFCGGEATLIQKSSGYMIEPIVIKNAFVAGCESCDIYTQAFESEIYQTTDGEVHINSTGVGEAVEAWNRRVGEQE